MGMVTLGRALPQIQHPLVLVFTVDGSWPSSVAPLFMTWFPQSRLMAHESAK